MKSRERQVLPLLAVSVAIVLHVLVVLSISSQPPDVGAAPASERSRVWGLFHDAVHRVGPAADFFAVYHAGVAMNQGRSPYQGQEDPRRTPYFYPFRYHPLVAATLGRAASLVSPRAAYLLWILTLELLLVGLVVLVRQRLPGQMERVLATWVLLVSAPYFLELHMGQFTFAAVGLAAVALLTAPCPSKPRQAPAASAFSAAVVLKMVPAAMIPALVLHRRWWLPVGLALALTVGGGLTWFTSHPGDWELFRQANDIQRSVGEDSGNFSIPHTAALILGRQVDPRMSWLWRILLGGWVLVTVLLCGGRNLLVGASALALVHFCTYPQVWEHHSSAVIVLGLLAMPEVTDVRSRAAIWGVLILLAMPSPYFLLDPIKNPALLTPEGWSASRGILLAASRSIPTLALMGILLGVLVAATTARHRSTIEHEV